MTRGWITLAVLAISLTMFVGLCCSLYDGAPIQELIGCKSGCKSGGAGKCTLSPRALAERKRTVEASLDDMPAVDAEARFAEALAASRRHDAEAGGAAVGPHRTNFDVRHRGNGLPAAQCSTGEQKALLIAILLATARLQADERGEAPLLLLDEVAAHLDARHRGALFDALAAIDGQAWMTGTDDAVFAPLGSRAQHFAVQGGMITVGST